MANNFDGNNIDNRSALEKDDDKHQSESNNYYIKELVKEKHDLDVQKAPNAAKLLDEEIKKIQEGGKPAHDYKYVDIYREKQVRVSVKVLVPVREHPKFNFVGKLLGPKGNSMKRLQEETMCRMAVLGKGSMKDKSKEEELRKSLDPKYAHLSDDLHVEIIALAPPAEAHARIAFALAEIRKYLIPDSNDNIRQEQLREMEIVVDDREDRRLPRPGLLRAPRPPVPQAPMRPSRPILPPPPLTSARIPSARSALPKTKVFSILDRARVALDQSYVYETAPPPSSRDYEYTSSSSSSRYPSSDRHYSSSAADDLYSSSRYSSYDYDDETLPHSSHDYYETSDYHHPIQRSVKLGDEGSSRAWKSYKTASTGSSMSSRLRSAPYSRPSK